MKKNDEITDFELGVRHFVYRHFALEARPPTVVETANKLGVSADQVQAAFLRLHDHHFFFLEPGTMAIRMANPFSAVPTKFKVHSYQKTYWANCAWDMLGIPAALKHDADIEAFFVGAPEPIRLRVEDGRVRHQGGLVHFPLPARRWYDDLILT